MRKRNWMIHTLLLFIACFIGLFCGGYRADSYLVQAQEQRLVDDAGLLSEEEQSELSAKLDEISERQAFDVIIVTENSLDGKTATEYADDYFDYKGYGMGEDKSGILFLVTMSERKFWMSTHGDAIDTFTDSGLEYIQDQIKSDLSDGNYYDAFDSFASLCEEFIIQAEDGEPYDTGNMPQEPMSPVWILISLGIGLALGLIITGIMRSQVKTVRMKPDAADYMKKNSLNLTRCGDMFLYNQVSRTAKPKEDSSGGGSSTHTSSSGETHGGSGGSF